MTQQEAHDTTSQPEETLEQIFSNHTGRWVAILVTRRDENNQPLAGRLVCEDLDRYRLRQKAFRSMPEQELCIFHTGDSQYPLLL